MALECHPLYLFLVTSSTSVSASPEISRKITRFLMKLAQSCARRFSASSTITRPERLAGLSPSMNSVKELHAYLIRTQLHTDPYSVSAVIKAYALSPSHLDKAHLLFSQIERPTLLVWNYMIRGLSLSDKPDAAIDMFHRLYHQALAGDNLTFIFVLRACARLSDVVQGKKVHVHAIKLGFESYLFVSNALIHMYASCDALSLARTVFDEMGDRDLVSWNSLICGYSLCNRFKEVLVLFKAMLEANVKPDAVTIVKVILASSHLGERDIADSVVKYTEENHIHVDLYLGNTLIDMYGRRGSVDLARQIFDKMKERNIVSWNAMIMGYAKVRNLVEARKLFDEMPQRDVISWTSMITGYSQADQFSDAMKLFQEMMAAKVKPDEITVASVLSCCANLGSLPVGQAIDDYIRRCGIKVDVYVENSLIDMYCKCGDVEKAVEVFLEMKRKDSVSWTSIISGLAVNGFANIALEFFARMLREGVQPTHGTFVGILQTCAHAGLVDKGLELFETMEKVYGLIPEMKHYGCIVDLLSRSGNLDRAYEFINEMPIVADVVVWRILLSACKLHGNVHLAEIATQRLLELDSSNSGNYVLLSNTYAGSGRWDDATKMRELMMEGDVPKPSGWSSIEVEGITSNNSQGITPCSISEEISAFPTCQTGQQ